MVRSPRSTRPGRSDRDRDNGDDGDDRREHEHEHEHEREDEPYDNPKEHLEIERRRFAGGQPPTPERYALAREQWYRLPGVVLRPSMDPVVGEPATDEAQPPGQAGPDEKGPDQ